jgi:hypothetical protein
MNKPTTVEAADFERLHMGLCEVFLRWSSLDRAEMERVYEWWEKIYFEYLDRQQIQRAWHMYLRRAFYREDNTSPGDLSRRSVVWRNNAGTTVILKNDEGRLVASYSVSPEDRLIRIH